MSTLWIDTDMGFDDIAAILAVMPQPGVSVAGISLVVGNAPLDIVVENALRAADAFGWSMPIHAGRTRPLLGEPMIAVSVLGPRGMRTVGLELPAPNGAALASADAIGALLAHLASAPEPTVILALGPLSNIAVALLARPDLAGRIEALWWMGGSAGPGNHTAAAEFNAFADPEAAAVVLEAGIPFRMIGLDVCRQVSVTLADAETVRRGTGRNAALLADLLEGYVRIASADGSRPMALYDPVAALALIDREAVRFAPAHVVVERAGAFTRGMTAIEWRIPRHAAPNAEVAVAADAARIRSHVLATLAAS